MATMTPTATTDPTVHHTSLLRRRLASCFWYSASFSWRFCSRCCFTVWAICACVAGLPLVFFSVGRGGVGVMCV